jgi:DNA-binding transcriptional ArsR family regulator
MMAAMPTSPPAQRAFGAIACRTRRKLLDALREREHSVGELVRVARVSQPAVSQHLKLLKRAGLVDERREGRYRYYRLEAEPLAAVLDWVRAYERFWNERLAALGRVLDEEGRSGR